MAINILINPHVLCADWSLRAQESLAEDLASSFPGECQKYDQLSSPGTSSLAGKERPSLHFSSLKCKPLISLIREYCALLSYEAMPVQGFTRQGFYGGVDVSCAPENNIKALSREVQECAEVPPEPISPNSNHTGVSEDGSFVKVDSPDQDSPDLPERCGRVSRMCQKNLYFMQLLACWQGNK